MNKNLDQLWKERRVRSFLDCRPARVALTGGASALERQKPMNQRFQSSGRQDGMFHVKLGNRMKLNTTRGFT